MALSSTESSTAPHNGIEYGTGLGPGKGALQTCEVAVQDIGQREERTKDKVSGGWCLSITGLMTLKKSLALSGTTGGPTLWL